MATFSRRVLQSCIRRSSSYTTIQTRKGWVSKLNSPSTEDYVAWEWEIVLLDGLAKLGRLAHEPDLGGRKRADAVFQNDEAEFCLDITAVSDKGFYKKNPLEKIALRLDELARKKQIDSGGFIFDGLDFGTPPLRGTKPRQFVPIEEQFESEIFNANFELFLDEIKRFPRDVREYTAVFPHLNLQGLIRFRYVPGRKGVYRTWYRIPQVTVVDDNTLYRALKEKNAQLKRCGYKGTLGVIVCDAGAEVFRPYQDGSTYSSREVVQRFLQEHTGISFVLTLSLRNHSVGSIRQSVEGQIIFRSEEPANAGIYTVFNMLLESLPQVRQTAENAKNELRFYNDLEPNKRRRVGRFGMTVNGPGASEIRMSSRELLEILAGRLTQEEICERFRFQGKRNRNLFEQQLRSGFLISSATVEHDSAEDDDVVILRFSGPDPAVWKFVAEEK